MCSVILEVSFEHLWRVRLQAGCTWMMASLRSTSLSWFCEMISISLRRSSTLTSRISLRLHGQRSEMSDAGTDWPQHNMLPLEPGRLGCSSRVRGARSGPKPCVLGGRGRKLWHDHEAISALLPRHWLRILSRLMREYFSSCALLSLSIRLRISSCNHRQSRL